MKIGLFFGTFNPIHMGHMIIGNYMAEYSDLDEVWFVVTPHNPLKKKNSLLADLHRYRMVEEATEDFSKLKPSNIEFGLPQPNYTVNTLAYLQEKYPEEEFCLIMGEDNLQSLHKWKNFEVLLENYSLYVYPRMFSEKQANFVNYKGKYKLIDAPIVEISSTFIRKAIKQKKDIRPMLPERVWKYIDQMNFYK
ncbi:nicotinate (nicotinamide) nucleotide adenylyltransferase [Namhaeicola litoreus]|uniref:Probable nicotinate-nucleotide adenylyltransferase n=1 Tax=Namhaeicola litoreus TaxID=1052145 RepID=A0ABW3XZA6_9FLAO